MDTIRSILRPLASLRLTVACFACAMVLIFAGTLAQVHEGVWTVVRGYFRSFVVLIEFQVFVPRSVAEVPGRFPFPGGFLIVSVMLVNLIAAHAVRFKLSWQRAGIIVTHLGVILLLVGEIVTGVFAREGNMAIDEGSSSNFVSDTREAELAVVDESPPDHDRVVVVGAPLLTTGATVEDPRLPFAVRVDSWMPNSGLAEAPADSPMAKADAGFAVTRLPGQAVIAVPRPRVTGVDGMAVDVPSAYVTVSTGGKALGTYLVGVLIEDAQRVEVDGKSYSIFLRFRREYKPYQVHLLDFRHDKFTGTEIPRNFSSRVRLIDEARGVDREVLISMNEPMRHAGETFYQHSFKSGDSGTVLQVVDNPGWLLPYASCALVTLGMAWHFALRLAKFMRRAA